jgi:hypothetical protein
MTIVTKVEVLTKNITYRNTHHNEHSKTHNNNHKQFKILILKITSKNTNSNRRLKNDYFIPYIKASKKFQRNPSYIPNNNSQEY